MTEAEWLVCADLYAMLRHLHERVSVRKMRLFACACCRRVTHLYPDPRLNEATETVERHAEGRATDAELMAVRDLALTIELNYEWPASARWVAAAVDWAAMSYCAADVPTMAACCAQRALPPAAHQDEMAAQCTLLREVIGNPFQYGQSDGDWLRWNRGATVGEMARVIADERRFDELPVLADALVEAGCDSEAVLRHCREGGPHVRGCWVVDLLTGKA
jgi:hypothetical protein